MLHNQDLLKNLRGNSFFYLLAILLFTISCNEMKVKKKELIKNTEIKEIKERDITEYVKQIDFFRSKMLNEQILNDSLIESLIPLSEREYLELYSLTYPSKKMNDVFLKIDSVIGRSAIENRGNSLKLYLEMSDYVDGEYAESYFEDVDFIINKNKASFCKFYITQNNNKMKRLKGFYEDYCE